MEQSGYSGTNIVNYLQDIEFPKSRQELIDYCEDLQAPQQIIDFLENMPDRQYTSWVDLMNECEANECTRRLSG